MNAKNNVAFYAMKTEKQNVTLTLPMGFFPGYPEDLKKKYLLSSLLLLP